GDEDECRQMLYTGFQYNGPAAVRYPRDTGLAVSVKSKMEEIQLGKAELRRQGREIAILAFGSMFKPSLEAAEHLNASLVNMRFVKPLDEEMIIHMADSHNLLVTVEENIVLGGAGAAVSECLARHNRQPQIIHLGLPDRFIEHGGREELLSDCGLDTTGIINAISEQLNETEGVALKGVV
ncbi:MAG: 1-deoxy-D-xylulose-5-phosphate synthase, partial [Gammaproteobacteria bacterium]|nr:1-deoxy-D-xylulose-5-phosphate synthase [Gammaproteobacteria bacterium]